MSSKQNDLILIGSETTHLCFVFLTKSVTKETAINPYHSEHKTLTGPVEAGVQGVPRHTQYLALHLVKTMFIPEKSGVRYLCAHPIFRGFHRPWFNRTISKWCTISFSIKIAQMRSNKETHTGYFLNQFTENQRPFWKKYFLLFS